MFIIHAYIVVTAVACVGLVALALARRDRGTSVRPVAPALRKAA
jgi:hypothetical protein